MQIKITNQKKTVIEKGVYYFALQDFPHITSLEQKNILDFITYEKLYGRETDVVCDNASILAEIESVLADRQRVKDVPLPDQYVYHATSLKSSKEIFRSGRLLSAVNVYGKTAEELAYEKRESLWNDPADFFEYIMFGWGNSAVGDYVVISDAATGVLAEEEFKKGFHTGVRFYFKYDDLIKHPRHIFDGYHAIKVKHEVALRDYLYVCVAPEQYRAELLSLIPRDLKNRVVFLAQEGLGIQAWSEKVHTFVSNEFGGSNEKSNFLGF